MIKATARSAPDREREINNLIRKADFNNDPFVQEFGLNISHNLMEVWILFSFDKYVLEFSLLALLVMTYILLSIKRGHVVKTEIIYPKNVRAKIAMDFT